MVPRPAQPSRSRGQPRMDTNGHESGARGDACPTSAADQRLVSASSRLRHRSQAGFDWRSPVRLARDVLVHWANLASGGRQEVPRRFRTEHRFPVGEARFTSAFRPESAWNVSVLARLRCRRATEEAVGWTTLLRRSADFQSAVSPISNRQGVRFRKGRRYWFESQQVGNPRYSRLEICATTCRRERSPSRSPRSRSIRG